MLYAFAKSLFFVYYRIFFRVRVTGGENIPATGPVILCSNHISLNDPLLLGSFVKRPVHFIAKRELYKNRLFSAVLRGINTIPISRGQTDVKSFREAMSVLEAGEVLGIFIQGRRMKESEMNDAKSGAAFFALKGGADVTVLPVKIAANYRVFGRISLNIGKPVDLSAYAGGKIRQQTLKEATELIMNGVSSL